MITVDMQMGDESLGKQTATPAAVEGLVTGGWKLEVGYLLEANEMYACIIGM